MTVNFDGPGIQIDRQTTGMNDGLCVPLGAADNRLNTRNQFALVEGFGEVIVSPGPKSFDLVVWLGKAGQDQDRCLHLCVAKTPQNLVSVNVRQHEIENDDVVIIQFPDFEAVFPIFGRVDHHIFRPEHQFDAFCRCLLVFNQKHAHIWNST